MKSLSVIAILALLLVLPGVSFAEDAPANVKKLAPLLMAYGEKPAIIKAVINQNAEKLSLKVIKKRDAKWRATSGVNDFIKSLLENNAAKELLKIEKSKPYFIEIFLMDNQGANVAMTNKTGDYWQGDEAKWQESYKGGVGALHVGKVEFDESVQAYLVQVSVPVMDNGKAIGAITLGINLDELGD